MMIELFKDQLEYGTPLTQEMLDEMPQKHYSSGEEKRVNDIPLWGFKVSFETKDDKEELVLTLFSLCEREFPYYQERYTVVKNPLSAYSLPIFIPKGLEDKYYSKQNDYFKRG